MLTILDLCARHKQQQPMLQCLPRELRPGCENNSTCRQVTRHMCDTCWLNQRLALEGPCFCL